MKKICTFLLVTYFIISAGTGLSHDGHPLPFLEQWNDGTFETNGWLTDGPNWSINWQEGQPQPSVQFTWDPIQADYQLALESIPLLADSLTEGSIYLDFILKLDNYLATGTEQMLVQVWNWDTQVWNTVSTYSNEDGSFGWLPEHINITDQAMEKVFKIRFLSIGENSLNIVGWYVDNIHVYRDCKKPRELEAWGSWQYQGVVLEWEPPYLPDEWKHWDDGIWSENSIGTGQEVEFEVAARWTPSQLDDYGGYEITQIAFVPGEPLASYNLRIWTGNDAENLVVDQPVSNPIIGQWNYVNLNFPMPIDIHQELWVGYYVNTLTGYPAGVDDGPAIDGFGNMMNYGGWQTLLEINDQLDFNWNIKAFIHQIDPLQIPELYAIYRKDSNDPFFLRDYADTNFYVDDSVCHPEMNFHCYMVSSVYINGSDTCESGFSNEECEFCIGINEQDEEFNLLIYPNPASDVLYIESPEEIKSVSIFDCRGIQLELWNIGTMERTGGDKVIRWNGDKGKVEVKLAGLAPGLYLVRVETGSGVVGRKVVKNR